MPILWSIALSGALGTLDINNPCAYGRIDQAEVLQAETMIDLSLARHPMYSLRFGSSVDLLPNENLHAPHAPSWATWGLAFHVEDPFGSYLEIGHYSGHGIPMPIEFRTVQFNYARVGVRFGKPLQSVPYEVK